MTDSKALRILVYILWLGVSFAGGFWQGSNKYLADHQILRTGAGMLVLMSNGDIFATQKMEHAVEVNFEPIWVGNEQPVIKAAMGGKKR